MRLGHRRETLLRRWEGSNWDLKKKKKKGKKSRRVGLCGTGKERGAYLGSQQGFGRVCWRVKRESHGVGPAGLRQL